MVHLSMSEAKVMEGQESILNPVMKRRKGWAGRLMPGPYLRPRSLAMIRLVQF